MGDSAGIFIRNGRLQVAWLTGSLRKPRVRAFVEKGPEDGEAALANAFSEAGIPVRKAAVAVPSRLVNVRKVTLPLTHEDQIGRTLRFQAERYLPGISPDDVAVDFLLTRKEKSLTELFLLIVKKSDLEEYLAPMRAAGIEAASITVDFAALMNAVAQAGLFEGASRTVVVHFTGEEILLLLVQDGRLQAVRRLPPGEESGIPARIAREVEYSLTSAGFEGAPDRAVLSGDLPGSLIVDALEHALDCEVTRFDAASQWKCTAGPDAEVLLRRFPVAPGAALGALGKAAVSVDFLREAYRYRTPYEVARKPLVLAAVLAVAFIAVELISTMMAAGQATDYYGRMNRHARSLFKSVVRGKKPKFSSTFHKTLAGLVKQRLNSNAGEQDWQSFLDFMRTLTLHLPTDDRTVILSVSFKGQKATLRGEADDVDSFEAVANSLEKSGKYEVRTPFRVRNQCRRQSARKPLSFTIELSPRRK